MSLYYITGVSGSGKSTVLAKLNAQGIEAYDVDEAGPVTAKWHNDHTGFIHPKSSVKSQDRTPTFLASHSWKVPRQEVEALSKQAAGRPVFVGGAIANEAEIIDLFETVFALVIDDKTLKHRLTNRTNNDWGKNAEELQMSLTHNHQSVEKYKQASYTLIDASRPIDVIVAEILNHLHDD